MNWVVNGKPEWMLYEFLPLNHYRCFPVHGANVWDPARCKFKNTMLYFVLCDVMCEQKFFTYNYFHSIFPVVFASRTNLFLFTTFRSRQTYTDTDGDLNWTEDFRFELHQELRVYRSVRTCLNIWQPTWHFEYLSFANINRLSCKIWWRPTRWLALSRLVVCNKLLTDG